MATTTTATKTLRALLAATSSAAGATTNSSTWDLSTTVGDQCMTAIVTNGGTGPTIAGGVTVQYSSDGGTTWFTLFTRTATTTNSATSNFVFIIPAGVKTVRAQCTGQTGQAVTYTIYGHEMTSLGNA